METIHLFGEEVSVFNDVIRFKIEKKAIEEYDKMRKYFDDAPEINAETVYSFIPSKRESNGRVKVLTADKKEICGLMMDPSHGGIIPMKEIPFTDCSFVEELHF